MSPASYIDALEREGRLLADTASTLDLTASVPTCPDWTLRHLIQHIGGVHRWAGEHIRDRRDSILRVDDFRDLVGEWPPDDHLVVWYRQELALLVDTLRGAPFDIECAVFLTSVDPLSFWSRRQAHEACIHRVDVESITGQVTPVDAVFAADGIDELVGGFVPRRFMKLRSATSVTLGIEPNDSNRFWALLITDEPVQVSNDRVDCDCVVGGSASDVYLALWNRSDDTELTLTGDRAVFDLFRQKITIKWA